MVAISFDEPSQGNVNNDGWALIVRNKRGGSILSESPNDTSLQGETNSENKPAVVGISNNGLKEGAGVYGESRNGSSSSGVRGNSIGGGMGIQGASDFGIGGHGSSSRGMGVSGTSDVKGVVGYSSSGDGVTGISESGIGIYAEARQNNGVALKALSTTTGPAIYGLGSVAGRFEGDVVVDEGMTRGDMKVAKGSVNVAKGSRTVEEGDLTIKRGKIKAEGLVDAQEFYVRGRTDLGGLFVNSIECRFAITSGAEIHSRGDVTCDGNIHSKANIISDGKISCTGAVECMDVSLRDMSEDFELSCSEERTEPGTVMVLTDNGSIRESRHAYDNKVAGIVSGAGGLKPGFRLGCDKQNNNKAH